MIGTDDPIKLRQAANVVTTYDAERDMYLVEADVRGINRGIMLLHSNGGHWADVEDINQFIYDLAGIPDWLTCDYTGGNPAPFEFQQVGMLERFDAANGTWAATTWNNLILDAITDADGNLHIGDVTLVLRQTTNDCPGTDVNAFEQLADGKFVGSQCSHAFEVAEGFEEKVGKLCANLPPTFVERTYPVVRTSVYDFGISLFSDRPKVQCTGEWFNGNFVCDTSLPFTVFETNADFIELNNFVFDKNGASKGWLDPTQATDVPALSQEASHVFYGTCGHGEAHSGPYSVQGVTADGKYDSSKLECF